MAPGFRIYQDPTYGSMNVGFRVALSEPLPARPRRCQRGRQGGHQRPDDRADQLWQDRDGLEQGDFNGDTKVDINDLTIVLTNYGSTTIRGGHQGRAGAIVPDPVGRGCISLLGLRLAKREVRSSSEKPLSLGERGGSKGFGKAAAWTFPRAFGPAAGT